MTTETTSTIPSTVPVSVQQTNPVTPLYTPMSIPADYAALGIITGYKAKSPEQLRLFLIGPSGGGKSTLLASIPKTLIIDFEDGAYGVPNPRAARVVCKSVDKLEVLITKLETDATAGRRIFDRIAFDTVDQFVDMMIPSLSLDYKVDDIREYGEKGGSGWFKLKNAVWDPIIRVERAGYSWICTGHVNEKTITLSNKNERTVTRPVLFPTMASQLIRNCEFFGFVRSTTEFRQTYINVKGREIPDKIVPETVYVMEFTSEGDSTSATPGKQRGVPSMAGRIVLPSLSSSLYGWDIFVAEYNRAVQSANK